MKLPKLFLTHSGYFDIRLQVSVSKILFLKYPAESNHIIPVYVILLNQD